MPNLVGIFSFIHGEKFLIGLECRLDLVQLIVAERANKPGTCDGRLGFGDQSRGRAFHSRLAGGLELALKVLTCLLESRACRRSIAELDEVLRTNRLVTLTGAGGIIALVLVNGLVFLIRITLKWHGMVPMWAAVLGVSISVSVGLIFGVWPAMKAAKLDPVEALRYE